VWIELDAEMFGALTVTATDVVHGVLLDCLLTYVIRQVHFLAEDGTSILFAAEFPAGPEVSDNPHFVYYIACVL
jgi:hypothetical protein